MVAEGKAQETAVVAQPPRIRRLNIIGRRNLFFAFSLLIIIPGIFSMWRNGFLLGIDFAGGTEFTVTFANHPSLAQVESAVAAENLNGSVRDLWWWLHRSLPAAERGFAGVRP